MLAKKFKSLYCMLALKALATCILMGGGWGVGLSGPEEGHREEPLEILSATLRNIMKRVKK